MGVVGAGQMGIGIALVAARYAKLPVTMVDSNPTQIDKGRGLMSNYVYPNILSLFGTLR